jgi:hypothetical protein
MGTDGFGVLGVDGRIILRCILKTGHIEFVGLESMPESRAQWRAFLNTVISL